MLYNPTAVSIGSCFLLMLIRCVARFHVWQFLVTVPVGIIVEDLSSGNSRYQFLVASLGTWHPLQNSGALLLTSVFLCVL